MLPDCLLGQIQNDDAYYANLEVEKFKLPKYNPKTHYIELTRSAYFSALITLRHYIEAVSDYYFGVEQKAKKIDLFMLTSSLSSPMGPGSDSEAIPIKFGKFDSYLVDSSQFGFEPLLINNIDKVYCYLPSMRGENPNKRHLNQFFHCEAEIKGDIKKLLPIVEGYIKMLSETILAMPNILDRLSLDFDKTKDFLNRVIESGSFCSITFDEAVDILVKNGNSEMVNFTKLGRDITLEGELELAKILNYNLPFWIRSYDRDRIAFYQKPYSEDQGKVINGDLIFPSIIEGSFGGEIVGCGQRQDDPNEILASLSRQNINPKPYQWYVDLRRLPQYQTTSGFGLGIERFITWALCRDDIKDVIVYPRLKNIEACP